jgi:DNA-binding NtrC family response regulator
MPPLRERREDIPALAMHFLAGSGSAGGFDPAVMHWLQRRDWPGNVRELRQVVGRLAAKHVGAGPISVGDVPQADRPLMTPPRDWRGPPFDAVIASALDQGAALREIGQHATETAIRLALAECGGNLPRAARRLGVTDRALQLRRAGRQAGSPAQLAPVTPSAPSFMP